MILLDHNATTPVDPEVLARFVAVEQQCPGNPDSLHGFGRAARAVVEAARREIADALDVPPETLFFTSGGTEANNLAVLGLGDPTLPVLAGPVEHASVLAPAGVRGLVAWSVDSTGAVNVEPPTSPVGLVCLVHAQNELGTVQPVREAAALARSLGVPLHVDLAQSLGRLDLREALAAADAAALTTHKAGGLRGCGVLYVRRGSDAIRPMLRGGAQERSVRPGTISPALCAATATAIRRAVGDRERRATSMSALRDAFVRSLTEQIRIRMLTPPSSLPNTAMVWLPVHDGRLLLPALDVLGVAVSQGSACSSGSPEPPRILRAIGLDDADARRCIRVSVGVDTTSNEITRACEHVVDVVRRLSRGADPSRA